MGSGSSKCSQSRKKYGMYVNALQQETVCWCPGDVTCAVGTQKDKRSLLLGEEGVMIEKSLKLGLCAGRVMAPLKMSIPFPQNL